MYLICYLYTIALTKVTRNKGYGFVDELGCCLSCGRRGVEMPGG